MKNKTKNATLKSIIDVILYENPSTQDEIAERLGITRRYVTKLLQPLIKEGVVRRAYIVDIKKFEEFPELFGEEVTSREYAGSFLSRRYSGTWHSMSANSSGSHSGPLRNTMRTLQMRP